MFTTRKWWLLLVAALLPLSAFAQTPPGLKSDKFIVTGPGTSSPINLLNTAIAWHEITWRVVGSASLCTIALDTSANASSWSTGGAITGQDCTSNGNSTVVNVSSNYVRMNMTALTLTAGSYIEVTWTGWVTNPNGGGGGGSACANCILNPNMSLPVNQLIVGTVFPNAATLPGATGDAITNDLTQIPGSAPTFIPVGLPNNLQTGATYTVDGVTDRGGVITTDYVSGSMAIALPQAGTTNFGNGFIFSVQNLSDANSVVVTPDTSTINGASSLTIPASSWATVFADSTNANYLARQGSNSGGGGGGSCTGSAGNVLYTPDGTACAGIPNSNGDVSAMGFGNVSFNHNFVSASGTGLSVSGQTTGTGTGVSLIGITIGENNETADAMTFVYGMMISAHGDDGGGSADEVTALSLDAPTGGTVNYSLHARGKTLGTSSNGGTAGTFESDGTDGQFPVGLSGVATESDSTGSGSTIIGVSGQVLVGGTNIATDVIQAGQFEISDTASSAAAAEETAVFAQIAANPGTLLAAGLHVSQIGGAAAGNNYGVLIGDAVNTADFSIKTGTGFHDYGVPEASLNPEIQNWSAGAQLYTRTITNPIGIGASVQVSSGFSEGGVFIAYSTATSGTVTGTDGTAWVNNASGTVTGMGGADGVALKEGDGDVGSGDQGMDGGFFQTAVSGGHVGLAAGAYVGGNRGNVGSNPAGGTIDEEDGLFVEDQGNANATAAYGIHLADMTLGAKGIVTGLGPNTFGDTTQILPVAFAFSDLPTCNGGAEGSIRPVSDSLTAVWGVTVTGSGMNHILAYCNGTNWTVMAK